jgi:hypothetical protein
MKTRALPEQMKTILTMLGVASTPDLSVFSAGV